MSRDVLFVEFKTGGAGEDYTVTGWSHPEAEHTWTLGHEAILRLPKRPDGGAGRLTLMLIPLVSGPLHAQRLNLDVDGVRKLDRELAEAATVSLDIPTDVGLAAGPPEHTIVLHLPDAASPASLNGADDARLLGVQLLWLRWEPLKGAKFLLQSERQEDVLLLHGAQTRLLLSIFERLPTFASAYRVVGYEPGYSDPALHQPSPAGPRYRAVWRQVMPNIPQPDTLGGLVGDEDAIISFPRLSLPLLWPFQTSDSRWRRDHRHERGLYPFPDSVAAELAPRASEPDDALLAAYRVLATERMPDPVIELGRYASELRWRDAGCDIKLADYILGQFRSISLFHHRDAPSGPLLIQLAASLLIHSDLLAPSALAAVLFELDELGMGFAGDWNEQVPVSPVAAAAYQLHWWTPEWLYHHHGVQWTFDRYIVDYIRWAPWPL